jgi:hypothetical protein
LAHRLYKIGLIWRSLGKGQNAVHEHSRHVWSVVLSAIGVIIEGIVLGLCCVLSKSIWVQTAVMEDVGQNLAVLKRVRWLPQKIVLFMRIQAILDVIVNFLEKLSFVTKICKEPSVCCGVSIGKYVPSNLWSNSEFLLHELMTHHHVIDEVLVVWASLIRGCPSAINNFKLAILDKFLEFFFDLWFLPAVPHLKVLDLGKTEASARVSGQLIGHGGQDRPDRGMVCALVGTCVVLVHCLLEAEQHRGVRNQMHS